jgi:SAM-dependent methyltransferase
MRARSDQGDDGWDESAQAWIDSMGEDGDYSRQYVLDHPMIERIRGRHFASALDVGCGEGRFCRAMKALGIATVGVDPTKTLVDRARTLDPEGDYRLGRAEDLDLPPGSFDLVVSYLSLIDIPDVAVATASMVEALRPGGTLLVANLTSFNSAGMPQSWQPGPDGELRFCIDHYLEERAVWASWHSIRVKNWHRPLSTYLSSFLECGLELKHFAEPSPLGGDPQRAALYRRVPWFYIMEWHKPPLSR